MLKIFKHVRGPWTRPAGVAPITPSPVAPNGAVTIPPELAQLIQRGELHATITRANGRVEDLGMIASTD